MYWSEAFLLRFHTFASDFVYIYIFLFKWYSRGKNAALFLHLHCKQAVYKRCFHFIQAIPHFYHFK
uniref:Uncharacterized protein n=1 Tax=Anguilla anguilla TaxID=7936 RepID=A0A0E9X501_ANGAN